MCDSHLFLCTVQGGGWGDGVPWRQRLFHPVRCWSRWFPPSASRSWWYMAWLTDSETLSRASSSPSTTTRTLWLSASARLVPCCPARFSSRFNLNESIKSGAVFARHRHLCKNNPVFYDWAAVYTERCVSWQQGICLCRNYICLHSISADTWGKVTRQLVCSHWKPMFKYLMYVKSTTLYIREHTLTTNELLISARISHSSSVIMKHLVITYSAYSTVSRT